VLPRPAAATVGKSACSSVDSPATAAGLTAVATHAGVGSQASAAHRQWTCCRAGSKQQLVLMVVMPVLLLLLPLLLPLSPLLI